MENDAQNMENPSKMADVSDVTNWSCDDVIKHLKDNHIEDDELLSRLQFEGIDGKAVLALNETDIHDIRQSYSQIRLGVAKRFWIVVRQLQKDNASSLISLGLLEKESSACSTSTSPYNYSHAHSHAHHSHHPHQHFHGPCCFLDSSCNPDMERTSPPLSVDGRATSIKPEFFKTMISLCYAFLVTWITAFVMVVVHERVPDMKRYPPLPDIFLDNVPHIPWAFHMCEITGTLLFLIWAGVLIVHKHRFVLLRRFFALSGTVFLLRCVTMLITSLSVPGTHLQCRPDDYIVADSKDIYSLPIGEAVLLRISRAYTIWSGLGMSIQGVRTCGDYMFSGHTVALTILNFFITEYTPRHLYFLHTLTWLLNMFGIFFILAAHEHYSIDVFVAFYITSRLFLYYHTLANNQALTSHDSTRTRIWFPMFSYFESSVDGIIPNEYSTLDSICSHIFAIISNVRHSVMLTARRCWLEIRENAVTPRLSEKLLAYMNTTDTKSTGATINTSDSVDGVQSKAVTSSLSNCNRCTNNAQRTQSAKKQL